MSRILILGGDGMLGHEILRSIAARHEVFATLRCPLAHYAGEPRFAPKTTRGGVDVRDLRSVRDVIAETSPDFVVNAVGIVKQRDEASEAVPSIEINSLFPHFLARLCREAGSRLIHYSTDCVFSGLRGGYTEADRPDPDDLYGRSKLLGEVEAEGVLTLRTSMIGFEIGRKSGLLEWFLAQPGGVTGYRSAIFSGLTTPEHARVIEMIVESRPWRSGLFHLSSSPISKFHLLQLVASHFGTGHLITPDDSKVVDRSLDSSRFRRAFGYEPPSWDDMVAELASLRKKECR